MKCTGPSTPSHQFKPGDLVWLEGTNIHTTHPKAKLAPKRHRPFRVVYSTPTNYKLILPKTWRVHPVFHNTLLSPYKETTAHGPNFTRPPPDIVEGEEEHYKFEAVLQSHPTPNKKGIQYLIKWKGYPSSENSWLPASQMKHAVELVKEFHSRFPKAPQPTQIKLLQEQQGPKEGMLSRTGVVTPEVPDHVTVGRSCDQAPNPAPRPSDNRSDDKECEHALMHAYFCRCDLCYVHDRY